MLAYILHPAAQAITEPPLLIAHGLYGSGRNWGVIARRLAEAREVIAVDMRNHGASLRSADHSYAAMAADLGEVARNFGGVVDMLGHSMGGKAAMQLALTQGEVLRKLVVADIAPVAYSHDQTQHIVAMRSLDRNNLTSRSEAETRLTPLVSDPGLRAFFLQSLDLKTTPATWKLNLNALEAAMPQIVGWPETEGTFSGPTLFLTGANSHYVLPEYRLQIRAQFPNARFAKILGAGHWLHAERPREFEETVRVFLDAD